MYNLACYYSLHGNKPMLLKTAARALELGKPAEQFHADSDFDAYRQDEDFQQLLNQR